MARVSFFGSCDDGLKGDFDFNRDYAYQDELKDDKANSQFALLEFEHPVTCSPKCLIIASKLDTDIHSNTCRLAFHGRVIEAVSDVKYAANFLPKLKVYKNKSREGVVERKVDDYAVICKGLFKKESNLDAFVNLKVILSTGENGIIESSFGQSGKFKVRIPGLYHFNVLK